MRNQVRRVAEIGWRVLIGVAIAALAIAVFATQAGSRSMSQTAGTFAWFAAMAGVITGLIVTFERKRAS